VIYRVVNCMKISVAALLLFCSAELYAVASSGGGEVVRIPDFSDFGESLTLVEEIDCASPPASADFSDYPAGISKVETIFGKRVRVLPKGDKWSYMTFTVGKGLKSGALAAGKAYVLSIEYPQDKPRSMFVLNRGCETQRGFYTGAALGDQLGGYVNANPESLQVPLSGRYEQWMQYFHLHHKYPDLYQPRDSGSRTQTPGDGFRVIIVHLDEKQAPVSAGASCSRIRLYEVVRPVRLEYHKLPDGLPKRHVFWREEMSDNLVHYADSPSHWGVPDDKLWYEYKMELMQFLGLRTFSKDLLEFGHCQGWQVSDTDWFTPTRDHLKDRWAEILDLCAQYEFDVIPYYEYYGSTGPKGLGREKRCVSLKGTHSYTGLNWIEKFNADVDTLSDAKRALAETMIRHKDKVSFVAAWFRARPSSLPVSFSDSALRRFEKDGGISAGSTTREKLRQDSALMGRYRAWWFGRRKAFLEGLRDYLRSEIGRDADLLFTWDSTEPGWTLSDSGKQIVSDDPERWSAITKSLQQQGVWWFSKSHDDCLANEQYLKSMKTRRKDWGADEWSNSSPEADPQNYRGADGVMLTHPIHRMYSMTGKSLDEFRTKSGLAVIRHYCLNENAPNHKKPDEVPIGYFVADVERAGPFSMMAEARAVALGNPNYLGYLASNSWNHGFPKYARRFYANYLSLPALPGTLEPGATDIPDVIVRKIATAKHGTWYAIVNLGYESRRASVRIEARGTVRHAPTGTEVGKGPGSVVLELYPLELVALHVR